MAKAWMPDALGGSVGQRSRWAELYRTHSPAAHRLAYFLTGDLALAEDLAQEAFIKVLTRFQDLRDEQAFPAYLRSAVINLANSHFRRARLERRHLQRRDGRHPSVNQPAVEDRDEMREALLALPVRQRAAIALRYYEDLTERETADVMGITPAAAKSLVARGMETLRKGLGPERVSHRSGGDR
ncbi:MAG TPA: SigE family RNA polymerase sigma factor [Actinomycetota bacterium]|nr:SigE family RNA polymerase sigma factor [Actinomycetota bacterium]